MTAQPPLPAIRRGHGHPILFLHGFALAPATYERTVDLLAQQARVIAPMWLYTDGEWSYEVALEALEATLTAADVSQVTLIGHSFGGGLALGLAARRPEWIERLVLVDTLGCSDGRQMARNAVPGRHLARLASLAATRDFFATILTRPRDVQRAAMWGYRYAMDAEIETVGALDLPKQVVWSETDALLPMVDGQRFAERLRASFHVVPIVDGTTPTDHDWAYRRPRLFVRTLVEVGALPESRIAPTGSRFVRW